MVWALADHQGTVRDLIDDGGSVIEHRSYDSFGNLTSTPTFDFRYGYTGRERDSETGLEYYRARYYDSAVGRFISEDPIGFAAGDSNIYRYVSNNVVNSIDPSGLEVEMIFDRGTGTLMLFDHDKNTYRVFSNVFSGGGKPDELTGINRHIPNNPKYEWVQKC
jgi:RHS repeat-associated protein